MGLDYLQSDSKIMELSKEIAQSDALLQDKIDELQRWEQSWNTKYIHYYTDLVDFWRLLYDIDNQDWNTNQHWNPDNVKCRRVYEYIPVANNKGHYVYNNNTNTWINSNNGTHDRDDQHYIDQLEFVNHKGFLFWFDFIDDAYLEKYKVSNIGRRPKVVNDNDVKAIFFEDTPDVLFIDPNETNPNDDTGLGYTKLNLIGDLANYVQLSTQGKSAKEALDNLIYTHTYYQEQITINCIPIYYLEPNVRISVYDSTSGINGDYIIKSYNLPLTHNGSMSITATRAEDLIL